MWDGVSQGASEPVWTWCFIAQSALGQLLFQVSEPNGYDPRRAAVFDHAGSESCPGANHRFLPSVSQRISIARRSHRMWFLSHGACVPRIDPSHAMRAENRPILQFRAIIIASRYIYCSSGRSSLRAATAIRHRAAAPAEARPMGGASAGRPVHRRSRAHAELPRRRGPNDREPHMAVLGVSGAIGRGGGSEREVTRGICWRWASSPVTPKPIRRTPLRPPPSSHERTT